MACLRVLISGGGIAGATLAYWLAAGGHRVTIVESADRVRSSGSPVDVRGPAAATARAMGIWPRLAAAATGVERLVFVDPDGNRRAVIRTRRSSNPDDEVEIARVELATALLDAVDDSAEIITGDSVAVLASDDAGVDARFSRGGEDRFDLAIGADGLHSAVRRLTFGAEQRFSRPMGLFIGTVRTDAVDTDPREVILLNNPGTALAIHPAGGNPGAAFIFRSRPAYDHHDPHRATVLIEDAYRDRGSLTERALAAWHTASDVYFDQVTRITVPSWSTGRIALVGDAASCVSVFGEGSSNAIVGARTLADAICASPTDPAAAFAAYERTHRRRTARSGAGAPLLARFLVPTTSRGISIRNTAIRTLGRIVPAFDTRQ
ncbi:FAD-dependent monooxygenase [Microbacterium deminutum]|uniref:FAD-dependent monooxygenase n=1 Tax=Microbacterium deminutum TaxID=344164 RepID=A0ABN2R5S0_9MICO